VAEVRSQGEVLRLKASRCRLLVTNHWTSNNGPVMSDE
jgi:hypothetical protein